MGNVGQLGAAECGPSVAVERNVECVEHSVDLPRVWSTMWNTMWRTMWSTVWTSHVCGAQCGTQCGAQCGAQCGPPTLDSVYMRFWLSFFSPVYQIDNTC